jgi:hypothetical protein
MATEISQVEGDSLSASKTSYKELIDSVEKDAIQVQSLDVEADSDDLKVPLYRAEKTELTPAEALT